MDPACLLSNDTIGRDILYFSLLRQVLNFSWQAKRLPSCHVWSIVWPKGDGAQNRVKDRVGFLFIITQF